MTTKPWLHNVWKLIRDEELSAFSRYDLRHLLEGHRESIGAPKSASVGRVLKYMQSEGLLNQIELIREGRRTTKGATTRFVTHEASQFDIALSLRNGSYLSHSTAVFMHGLTDQVPKTIYVNKEQSPKPSWRGRLTQPAIDRAFSNAPRTSKYVFLSQEYRYVLLSGKDTGRKGVVSERAPNGNSVDVTNVERTLIDIVVRPIYSGGIFEVLDVYKRTKGGVSVDDLVRLLEELDYVYPYHQSIGFLMERAGYGERQLKEVERFGIKWDFYLDYRISGPEYSERWRLFYPKGI